MNLQTVAVIISALSLIGVGLVILDRIKKKNPDLVDRALNMVKIADEQADNLRVQLVAANKQIDNFRSTVSDLQYQLDQANTQLTTVNRELHDAHMEVGMLRTQVQVLTKQVQERNDRNG